MMLQSITLLHYVYYSVTGDGESLIDVNCNNKKKSKHDGFCCVWNEKESRFKKDFGHTQNLS